MAESRTAVMWGTVPMFRENGMHSRGGWWGWLKARGRRYLAAGELDVVHVDGGEEVLKQGGCQAHVLAVPKVVHHQQGGRLKCAGWHAGPRLRGDHVPHQRVAADPQRQRWPLHSR